MRPCRRAARARQCACMSAQYVSSLSLSRGRSAIMRAHARVRERARVTCDAPSRRHSPSSPRGHSPAASTTAQSAPTPDPTSTHASLMETSFVNELTSARAAIGRPRGPRDRRRIPSHGGRVSPPLGARRAERRCSILRRSGRSR